MSDAPLSQQTRWPRALWAHCHAYLVLETSESAAQSTEEFNVPPGFFFVLGDNRGNSLDSRYKDLGYIPIANVIGTVRTIYWSNEPARFLSSVQ